MTMENFQNNLAKQLDHLLEFVNQIPAMCEPLCDPLYGYVQTDDETEESAMELKAQSFPRPIIIDSGSGSTKIGYAGNSLPTLVVPNIVCRQTPSSMRCFVGDDAIDRIGHNFYMSNPVRRGVVINFNDAGELWSYAMRKIGVQGKHPVVLTQSPLAGNDGRKQILEVLFEGMRIPGVMLVSEPLMALHASGRTTGVVLDVGDELAYVVPIVNDVIQRHAIMSISLGGRDLTDYLITLLQQRFSVTFQDEKRAAEQIKKIYGYVATNIGWERDLYQQVPTEDEYVLSSDQLIRIGAERFECAEPLFEPLIIGKKCQSLQQLIVDAVRACSIDVQKDLWRNVILTGGTTMMDGFGQRLKEEIHLVIGRKLNVRVITPAERQFGVWFGASMLAERHMDPNDPFWVSVTEYYKSDPDEVVKRMLV